MNEWNKAINYYIGIILIFSIFIFFPDYTFPLTKENIMESIGQVIVALSGVGIIFNEMKR